MHNKLLAGGQQRGHLGGREEIWVTSISMRELNELVYRYRHVLSVGPVAEQLDSFDQYWNSALRASRSTNSSPANRTAKDLQNTRTRLEESLDETRKQEITRCINS